LKTEIGEQIVGAYLKYIKNCEIITYNVRSPGGGLEGLNEFDVIGFNFEERKVFIAEVTTHICGTLYYNYENTIKKIKDKHRRQIIYAEKYLKDFSTIEFMFWSPRVPEGKLMKELEKIDGIKYVINKEYRKAIEELIRYTKDKDNDLGNDF